MGMSQADFATSPVPYGLSLILRVSDFLLFQYRARDRRGLLGIVIAELN